MTVMAARPTILSNEHHLTWQRTTDFISPRPTCGRCGSQNVIKKNPWWQYEANLVDELMDTWKDGTACYPNGKYLDINDVKADNSQDLYRANKRTGHPKRTNSNRSAPSGSRMHGQMFGRSYGMLGSAQAIRGRRGEIETLNPVIPNKSPSAAHRCLAQIGDLAVIVGGFNPHL